MRNLCTFPGDNIASRTPFDVYQGEVLIVGESGCGKSTLLRIMIGLVKPYAGQVFYEGTEITSASESL